MNQTQVNNFLKCFLQIDEPAGRWVSRHDDEDHDHDHDHEDEDDGSGVLVAKVTAMVVLFCASTICGSIPFLLNRCYRWTESQTNARSAIVVKCLLYFGGGVLLATTFLHLLPEVQEVVEELQECGIIGELTFPLAELLMCCGFFLMYFIEEAMHTYVHHHQKDEAGAAFERGHSIRNSHLLKPTEATAPPANQVAGAGNATSELGTLSVQNLLQNDLEQQKFASKPQSQANGHAHGHSHGHGHGHGHGHSHLPVIADDASAGDMLASSLRGLFIVSALSLHELFEGMAIGLESSASSVWFMFGAVSAHKLVLAFCVGVELIVARTRVTLAVIYVLTFAVVSPLGIGIGILINHGQETTGPSLVSAILQGFACGTLIYVVFFEILSKNRSGLRAYLALFVGFLVMFGLQQLTSGGGHGHSHSHSSCSAHTDDHHETETRSGSDHVHDHEHDHDHAHPPPHHNHAEELAAVHNYEQQLQLLRQVTQKLLEAHPKKDA
ncbi:hypothetical protein KR038_002280 [Drosophila bunnanda]|nr:hypothetical protein KR038_002280 [Drosophila bunnanda]